MVRKGSIFLIVILLAMLGYSQEENGFKPSGSPFMKVYFNYHTDLRGQNKMQISRAYLGYHYHFSKEFSAKVNLDVGNFDDGAYMAFLKIAQLQYKKGKVKIKAGMIPTKQFKVQEKFWGYRYIYKSFQDEYKFNGSADLGMSVDYQLMKNISVDFIIQNGEGYKHIKSTGHFREGLGIGFSPVKSSLLLRVYTDITSREENNRISYAGFIGYKYHERFKIAVEYLLQKNNKFNAGNDLSGFSAYATYFINKSFNIFGRYDLLNSNILPDEETPWNSGYDGSGPIGGIEYIPRKNIHLSLNYRGWQPVSGDSFRSLVYLNFAFQVK